MSVTIWRSNYRSSLWKQVKVVREKISALKGTYIGFSLSWSFQEKHPLKGEHAIKILIRYWSCGSPYKSKALWRINSKKGRFKWNVIREKIVFNKAVLNFSRRSLFFCSLILILFSNLHTFFILGVTNNCWHRTEDNYTSNFQPKMFNKLCTTHPSF